MFFIVFVNRDLLFYRQAKINCTIRLLLLFKIYLLLFPAVAVISVGFFWLVKILDLTDSLAK